MRVESRPEEHPDQCSVHLYVHEYPHGWERVATWEVLSHYLAGGLGTFARHVVLPRSALDSFPFEVRVLLDHRVLVTLGDASKGPPEGHTIDEDDES